MIYLDNAATTRPCAEAVAAVNDALTARWGNPSAVHRLGIEAARLLRTARQDVAEAELQTGIFCTYRYWLYDSRQAANDSSSGQNGLYDGKSHYKLPPIRPPSTPMTTIRAAQNVSNFAQLSGGVPESFFVCPFMAK